MAMMDAPARGTLGELVVYFLRLGLLGFGGPVALVGQMERELVADRGWLTKEQMREPSPSVSRSPGHWRSRLGSTSRICDAASGERGPAGGRSSCLIL